MELLHGRRRSGRPTAGATARSSDRQDEDQRGAEERADQAAEAADDHHEQDEEGLWLMSKTSASAPPYQKNTIMAPATPQ